MNTKELFFQRKFWAERSALLMGEFLPLLGPFIDHDGLDPEAADTLGMLLDAASRSTESAFLLMSFGKLWDAELVVRSVFEASIKFVYLIHTKNDLRRRHEEFAEHQFQMAAMKDDQKARDALASIPDVQGPEWEHLHALVLPDIQRDKLRETYDKAARRSMETRWGYTGLLNVLIKSGDPAYSTLGGLFYGYTTSSHLHHADYVGISIVLGQSRLEPRMRDATHLSHLARLIRDCFTCYELRLGAVCRFTGIDTEAPLQVRQRINDLWTEMTSSNMAWLEVAYGQAA